MSVDYQKLINRDLPRVERGCTSKVMFISRGEAKALLRRRSREFDGRLRPYRCRHCPGWHLGHRTRA